MLAWRNTALVNRTDRIGFRVFDLFRKIDEDFGGYMHGNRAIFPLGLLPLRLQSAAYKILEKDSGV